MRKKMLAKFLRACYSKLSLTGLPLPGWVEKVQGGLKYLRPPIFCLLY
jgi:hypothetical protein